jgi:ribosomal protein S12 methylthiotransferase accessory factor
MRIFDRDYSQPKTFLPGTRRTRSPAETLRDFGRHMPEVGITRLANVTGLDTIGIPVVQAVRPNSRSLSVSQGKGVDVDSAKASAMMEAIELWHAERIELPCLCASYQAIKKKERVVDLTRLPLVKGARLRPEEQRCWLRGWDLLQKEEVWVPFEVVSMNTIGVVQAVMTFSATSNGLASGNHILEAIEHALCEVIERDAHALDWARGMEGSMSRKVDLSTIADPSLRAMIDACAAAEVDVAVFEMDSDVGVPSFRAGLVERKDMAQWRRMGTQWGCGTHLSPVIALSRAITEAAQARLTVIAGSRDDNPPAAYATSQEVGTAQRFRDTAFAAPAARAFPAKGRLPETGSFEGDLEVMLEAIRGAGAERAVVLDLSKPHIGIPVVKVVVPELEAAPFLPGYVEGVRARRAREGDAARGAQGEPS